ncbi:unnamed protein product [Closterium sp. NIES-54]
MVTWSMCHCVRSGGALRDKRCHPLPATRCPSPGDPRYGVEAVWCVACGIAPTPSPFPPSPPLSRPPGPSQPLPHHASGNNTTPRGLTLPACTHTPSRPSILPRPHSRLFSPLFPIPDCMSPLPPSPSPPPPAIDPPCSARPAGRADQDLGAATPQVGAGRRRGDQGSVGLLGGVGGGLLRVWGGEGVRG